MADALRNVGYALAALAGGAAVTYGLMSTARAAEPPSGQPDTTPADPTPAVDEPTPPASGLVTVRGVTWKNVLPDPTAADVVGDLETNWGDTPTELRPYFMFLEEKSRIVGSGRLFSVIAYGESRYVESAQNGDGDTDLDRRERAGSGRAWEGLQKRGIPLKYGEDAAKFGSGGYFGALAPYFLATGINALGKKNAPLRYSNPRIVWLKRVAGWGAIIYMQRLLVNYTIDDHPAIKVGWASPSFLKGDELYGTNYQRVHAKFTRQAGEVGIDLEHTPTIPKKLSTANFPGVMPVFREVVGTLPVMV